MSDPSTPIRHVLARHPEIRLAILFGSLAGGNARPDSDVDLAVAADRPLDEQERIALIEDMAQAAGRPVDLVDLATAGEPLLGSILDTGRRLQGSDEAYARLLVRHLFDKADFLPYRDRILAERRQGWIGES